MSQYLLYVPLMFVVLLVLEMCREEPDPRRTVRRAARAFLIWTAVLVVASGVAWAIQELL
jgi:hypothetical protein